jgi:hypothetical protein
MAAGGAVKKAAKGGFLKESNSPKGGDAYPGFPHSPTTKAKSTVSAKADGGGVKKHAGGGGITLTKKLEFGGAPAWTWVSVPEPRRLPVPVRPVHRRS